MKLRDYLKDPAAGVSVGRHWRPYVLDHHSRTCPNEGLGSGVGDPRALACVHCDTYKDRATHRADVPTQVWGRP